MKYIPIIAAMAALSAAMISTPASAGKGAVTHACIFMAQPPRDAITGKHVPTIFKFTTEASQAMNDSGKNATLTVTSAGVTCVSVGYVEGNASMFRGRPEWVLSYSGTGNGTVFSGSVSAAWEAGTGVTIFNGVESASVNISPTVSTNRSINFNGQGPVYFVFKPNVN
ncbi:MAG: hypothetical protein COB76_06150 [Alphaproteobacteria bacterium]|nr:MAG: hypothetical protein COB76_06150 [Alphaproteobacteria bacterium]